MGFWDPLLQQPVRSLSKAQVLALLPLTTEGDLLYFHLGANTRLPIGANGTFLHSNGIDPAWAFIAKSDLPLPLDHHTDLTDFTAFDDHTQYLLLAGRAGGQIANGGTAAGQNLTLHSTADPTRGKILFGTLQSAYDEANVRLGIGTIAPTGPLHVVNVGAIGDVVAQLVGKVGQTGDDLRVTSGAGAVLVRIAAGGFTAIDVSGNSTLPGTTALYIRGNSTTVNDGLSVFDSNNVIGLRVTNTRVVRAVNQCYVGADQSPAGTHTLETSGTALIAGTFATAATNGVLIQDNGGTAGAGLQGLDRRTDITSFKPLSLNANSPAATVYVGGSGATTPGGGDVTLMKFVQNVSSGGAPMLDVPNNASYNPGASPATTTCIRALNTMTRSAGTGNITNIGIRTGGTGAQINRSLVADNGMLRITSAALTLVNGVNDDVGEPGSTFIRITGPSAGFSVTSIRGGSTAAIPPVDGDVVILYNTTTQAMTITNEAGTGTAANRIHTASGADFVTTGEGVIFLIYDGTLSRWRDVSSLP